MRNRRKTLTQEPASIMSPWKTALLNAYYFGSLPLRRWRLRRAEAERRAPILVFFYHRIADEQPTPWTLSNHLFERQIDWLRNHVELVSLEEAQRRIAAGDNPRVCASITFDDGYAENCRSAIPYLLRHRVPCTCFVTVENALHGTPFAHDQRLGYRFAPNTIEQLRAMSAAGVEIGAHSYSHADIGGLADPRAIHREVVTARDELQRVMGREVRYFAFPFGLHANLHPLAFRMAREAGYQAVCSAYGGYNFPGDDPFHIQRIHGDAEIRLKNWATLDPRKYHIARFQYDLSTSDAPEAATASIDAH
jgi:peptidoglycan/xylan/chitin deacetylase (PgdA/CDA1 family)